MCALRVFARRGSEESLVPRAAICCSAAPHNRELFIANATPSQVRPNSDTDTGNASQRAREIRDGNLGIWNLESES